MANNTDIEKITQELERRFAAPLPEFYERRLIFWKDEDREFEDAAPVLTLTNAKVVALNGTNNFAVKRLLTAQDTASNYLVYDPLCCPQEENWLLPLELYGEEFRADRLSIWMDDAGLANTAALRKAVKGYRAFFKTKAHRAKIAALPKAPETPPQLHLAVMAAVCGARAARPDAILRAVLSAGLAPEENAVYAALVEYGADEAFWAMAAQGTGYRAETPDLTRLACHLLLTAATRTLRREHLAGLEAYYSAPHQAYCFDVVSDWLHSEERGALYELARAVEDELRLPARFAKLNAEDLQGTEIFPCIDECILTRLMTEIGDHIIDVDTITAVTEKRRTCVWYGDFRPYYEGIAACAELQAFYREHAAGFHTVEAYKVWGEYTSEYYKMDSAYRRFHCCFAQSLRTGSGGLDDLFKQVADKVEGLYSHWFLGELGQCWATACAEELETQGRILQIPRQEDFYRTRVAAAGGRVFVIVSDALRYEVAASLAEQLRRETQAKVELGSMAAIFPTVTKFGMAALLPHKSLTVEQRPAGLCVLADGAPTDMGSRDAALKRANSASVALKYKDLIKMKRTERSALVKGREVVYIYHDRIDEAGHSDEGGIFPACEDATTEIKNLIRIIVNEFGGTNIFVTADHGFLYTYKALTEDAKVDKTTTGDEDVEVDRRYLITRKGAHPQYLMPVRFLNGQTDYAAFAPRESVRIKKKGGGLNFVHGGASLQEMVVPVVEYHYLRSQTAEYQRNRAKYDTKPVGLSLLSAGRKVGNMIFSLNFYQTEPVGDNREAATYLLYFADSEGKQVSDTQRIIADKTDADNTARTFRCGFNLRSMKFDSKASYYLVIADESGLQAPQREEFMIDIAFAVDDFDFFG